MDMQEFIDNNRTELSNLIWKDQPNIPLDDDELEMWINNDEGLYLWAKSEGVSDEEDEEEEEKTTWECDNCGDIFSVEDDGDPIYINEMDVCKTCANILELENAEEDE